MRCTTSGPTSSSIAIVGEAPGEREEAEGLPFIGASGDELTRMLKDAGIMREACFITNVTHERPPGNEIEKWIVRRKSPPDASYVPYRGRWVKPFIVEEVQRLHSELRAVQPNVVIAFGDSPLWALCDGKAGIGKWRGSHLVSDAIPGLKVIPTYHPAYILRNWKERWITVQDLRRAKGESYSPLTKAPQYTFLTKPNLRDTRAALWALFNRLEHEPTPFTCDLEIYRREILCVGLGLSRLSAVCIPFLYTGGQYWSPEEHTELTWFLRKVLLHPNARVVNQNLSFDIQYLFWRFFIRPRAYFDTMVAQNVLWSGQPKDLAYLASMYNDYYVYWKDDGKFWENFNDEELWRYNCIDCAATFEVYEKQQFAIINAGLSPQMGFQMDTLNHLITMMLRGVRVDHGNKVVLLHELENLVERLHGEVAYLTQKDLRGEKGDFSAKRIIKLFYGDLKFPAHYKDGSLTCDDETLIKIAHKYPWVRPLTDRINMVRSYGTAVDACRKRTDQDYRWRTSYNVAGTTTYRLSSSENPLDSGLNLQNLTIGKDIIRESTS